MFSRSVVVADQRAGEWVMMPTVCNDIHAALKGFNVKLVSISANGIEVVIGSCGRKMDKTRTFKAKSVEAVVKQIKKNFN